MSLTKLFPGLIRYVKRKLVSSIETQADLNSVGIVNIWEFADQITDKPDPNNYETWDWSPATYAAVMYCLKYRELTYVTSAQYYQSMQLHFPGGFYQHKKPLVFENQGGGNSSAFASTLKITGDGKTGTTLVSSISNDPMFTLLGLRVCIEDISFRRLDATISNVCFLKLGDESGFTPCSHSTFRNLYFSDATKPVVIGHLFDSVFQSIHIIGLRPSADSIPTGIEILPHVSDSSNQISFIGVVLETAYSDDAVLFKAVNTNATTPHHSIHWYGCHFETVWNGALCVYLEKCAAMSFNGVNFVSNGDNTHVAATQIHMNTCARIDYNSCYYFDDNTQTVVPSTGKMIKIAGRCANIVFDKGFWASPYANISTDSHNFAAIVDYTESTYGDNSIIFSNVTLNNYNYGAGSNQSYLFQEGAANRSWRTKVLSGTTAPLSWSFGNDIFPADQVVRMQLDSSGYLSLPRSAGGISSVGGINGGSLFTLGLSSGASGERYIRGYTGGDTTVTQEIKFNGSAITLTAASILPAVTASMNLGSASYAYNNITLQNSPIVLSDGRFKTMQSDLTDDELKCAVACGKLYKKYKLNLAVQQKGEDARFHFGVIAQEIIQVFTDHGLDWRGYGIVAFTSWDAEPEVPEVLGTDEEGFSYVISEYKPAIEAGDRYEVRYDELNSFVLAGQEYRISKLEGD